VTKITLGVWPSFAPPAGEAADRGLSPWTGHRWVYPGGQSENPASPWYQNLIEAWWNGEYLALPVPGRPAGPVTWSLHG
jgi:acyl-homoserine lactone acylase PvdQ